MKKLWIVYVMLCLVCTLPGMANQMSSDGDKVDLVQQHRGWPSAEVEPVQHLCSTGGPDTFGYMWIDSDEWNGPSYSWIDITGTGTEIATTDELGDDDRTGPYPIDFIFPFYGFAQEEFWVQSNGMITFNGILYSGSNQALPFGAGGPIIAWFWDDLDPGDGQWGSVYYENTTIGMQDVCIITFDDYAEYPGSAAQDRITAQVILFDDGLIRIQYQSIDAGFDRTSCTIGIQNHDGSDGLTYVHNDGTGEYPSNQLVVDFVPPDPTASLSGVVSDLNGNGLGNANVRIGCGQTSTDAAGNYTINGVYPGTYPYIVWKPNYDALNVQHTLVSGANTDNPVLHLSSAPIVGTFSDNFEGGSTPLLAGSYEWEFGTPTYDPVGAYSGSNAWSTLLNGDYANDRDDWLTCQTGFTVPTGFSLKYYHWFDYEGGSDGYNVWVSTDAGAFWTLIYPTGGYPDADGFYTPQGLPCFNNLLTNDERQWIEVEFPLDDWVGQTVWFGFRHQTDPGGLFYSGVTIDNWDFSQGGIAPTVTLTLTPLVTSVPSYGGNIVFDATIVSTYPVAVTGDAWTDVILPNGTPYGPLIRFPITVPPGTTNFWNAMQAIPAYAPPGMYLFSAYLGLYPYFIATADGFPFTKTIVPGPDGEMITEWKAAEWGVAAPTVEVDNPLPQEYKLGSVHPNPFNASATVTVDLPDVADLAVAVYNIEGRLVTTLHDGQIQAGSHVFTLDGLHLASGLYFVRANVPGHLEAVQKVTLLK